MSRNLDTKVAHDWIAAREAKRFRLRDKVERLVDFALDLPPARLAEIGVSRSDLSALAMNAAVDEYLLFLQDLLTITMALTPTRMAPLLGNGKWDSDVDFTYFVFERAEEEVQRLRGHKELRKGLTDLWGEWPLAEPDNMTLHRGIVVRDAIIHSAGIVTERRRAQVRMSEYAKGVAVDGRAEFLRFGPAFVKARNELPKAMERFIASVDVRDRPAGG